MAEQVLQPGIATTKLFRLQEVLVPSTGNTVEMENIVISDPTSPTQMAGVDAAGRLLVNNYSDSTGAGDMARICRALELILSELQTLNGYFLQSGLINGSIQSSESVQSVQ